MDRIGCESHRCQLESPLDRIWSINNFDPYRFRFQFDLIRIGSAANRIVFGWGAFAIEALLNPTRIQMKSNRIMYESDHVRMESDLDSIFLWTECGSNRIRIASVPIRIAPGSDMGHKKCDHYNFGLQRNRICCESDCIWMISFASEPLLNQIHNQMNSCRTRYELGTRGIRFEFDFVWKECGSDRVRITSVPNRILPGSDACH